MTTSARFQQGPKIAVLNHRDPVVAQAIVALQRRAYRAEADLIGFPALPPLRESPADIMASAEIFLGITSRGRLVAAISTEPCTDSTAICRLCVAPECTRRGYAAGLVRHVLEEAPGEVVVSTARDNIPAIALYRKFGFEQERESTSGEGLALVVLRCRGSDRAGGR